MARPDNARFGFGHEVWTDGEQVVVCFPTAAVAAYDRAGTLTWFAPGRSRNPKVTLSTLARWGARTGWPSGATDAAGSWWLRDRRGDGTIELIGPDGPAVDLRVSAEARLEGGPQGVVLVDPGSGTLAALDDGVRVEWSGGAERAHATRVPGGFVVHVMVERRPRLRLLGDDGRVREERQLFGAAAPLLWVGGRLLGLLDRDDRGPLLTWIDPETLELEPDRSPAADILPRAIFWAACAAADRLVVFDGAVARLLGFDGRGWKLVRELQWPAGDPSALAGPTAFGDATVAWEGPVGPFEVHTTLRNRGQTRQGVSVRVEGLGAARLARARVGEEEVALDRGGFLPVLLEHEVDLPVVLTGTASGPASLRVVWVGEGPIGTLTVDLRITAAALRCVRGDQHVPLDPRWVAELNAAGLLDPDAPEPDLDRWMPRALARCRVTEAAEAPERVHATWRDLSSRDRSACPGAQIPSYKLSSGREWVLTDGEAAQIAAVLGPRHPLGKWAAGGSFEVHRG